MYIKYTGEKLTPPLKLIKNLNISCKDDIGIFDLGIIEWVSYPVWSCRA